MIPAGVIGIALLVLLGVLFAVPYAIQKLAVKRLAARCRAQNRLVLSFDDGPGPTLTPRLLAELRSHGVRATFFSLGRRATRAPEILDEVVKEGHEIGCHSFHHRSAWRTLPGAALADIRRGYASLAPWVPSNGLFRPPHGKTTLLTLIALRSRGARLCLWTHDGGDTWTTLPDIDQLVQKIIEDGGGVVLLHDFDREGDGRYAEERRQYVCRFTSKVIQGAKEAGMELTTMGELLGSAGGR